MPLDPAAISDHMLQRPRVRAVDSPARAVPHVPRTLRKRNGPVTHNPARSHPVQRSTAQICRSRCASRVLSSRILGQPRGSSALDDRRPLKLASCWKPSIARHGRTSETVRARTRNAFATSLPVQRAPFASHTRKVWHATPSCRSKACRSFSRGSSAPATRSIGSRLGHAFCELARPETAGTQTT